MKDYFYISILEQIEKLILRTEQELVSPKLDRRKNYQWDSVPLGKCFISFGVGMEIIFMNLQIMRLTNKRLNFSNYVFALNLYFRCSMSCDTSKVWSNLWPLLQDSTPRNPRIVTLFLSQLQWSRRCRNASPKSPAKIQESILGELWPMPLSWRSAIQALA